MKTVTLVAKEFDEWFPAINFRSFSFLVSTEDICTIRFQQARDISGTDAKDVLESSSGGVVPGFYSASVNVDQLDAAHPPGQEFAFIAALNVAGTLSMHGVIGEEPLLLPVKLGVESVPDVQTEKIVKTKSKKKSTKKVKVVESKSSEPTFLGNNI